MDSLAQYFPTLVLKVHRPACFPYFPAPAHLIQMNGPSSAVCRALKTWPIHLNQVCWSRKTRRAVLGSSGDCQSPLSWTYSIRCCKFQELVGRTARTVSTKSLTGVFLHTQYEFCVSDVWMLCLNFIFWMWTSLHASLNLPFFLLNRCAPLGTWFAFQFFMKTSIFDLQIGL